MALRHAMGERARTIPGSNSGLRESVALEVTPKPLPTPYGIPNRPSSECDEIRFTSHKGEYYTGKAAEKVKIQLKEDSQGTTKECEKSKFSPSDITEDHVKDMLIKHLRRIGLVGTAEKITTLLLSECTLTRRHDAMIKCQKALSEGWEESTSDKDKKKGFRQWQKAEEAAIKDFTATILPKVLSLLGLRA